MDNSELLQLKTQCLCGLDNFKKNRIDTMTIEERGKAYMHGDIDSHPVRLAMYNAYVDGAKDQKQIDIDKACDVYRKELEEIIGIFNRIGKDLYGIEELGELIHLEGSVKDFRKAMEE